MSLAPIQSLKPQHAKRPFEQVEEKAPESLPGKILARQECERVLKSLNERTFKEENPERLGEFAAKLYNTDAVRALLTLTEMPSICPPVATAYFNAEKDWALQVKTLSISLDEKNHLTNYQRFLPLCRNLEFLSISIRERMDNAHLVEEKLEGFINILTSNKTKISVDVTFIKNEDDDLTRITNLLKFA